MLSLFILVMTNIEQTDEFKWFDNELSIENATTNILECYPYS